MAEPLSCVFCDIAVGKTKAYKIYEDELSMCILDIHPYTKGHCLVIPKRHVPWWYELTDEENVSIFRVAKIVAGKMMKKIQPDFIFLWARGTRIPHAHIFLIPTCNGDGLDMFFNALENFQEAPQMLAGLKTHSAMEEAARLLKS